VKSYHIDFEPVGRRGSCSDGKSLLDCARELGVGIIGICGGRGKCQSCKVKLINGTASEPTSMERETFSSLELNEGWRLACQAYPTSDCKLSIPSSSLTTAQRTQVEGREITLHPEPAVHAYELKLSPPSLSDLRADADHLLEVLNKHKQLGCQKVDIDVLRQLTPKLRSWNWRCQALVRGGEVIAVNPCPSRQLGLAIDLGTTKIAGYLVDLSTSQTIAAKGVMNPQISYGEDIISRITRVIHSPSERPRLSDMIVQVLNQLALELCTEVVAQAEEIVDAVVVGNTAMHHLFLNLPVESLAYAPYTPLISQALDVKARDLGLRLAPGAYVHLLPNIGGFVGSDHVAMLLALGAWKAKEICLAIDIGTNTEVSLIEHGSISTVSCASGPAFEGGHIRNGMRAASGAIERVSIEGAHVYYQTIDEVPPVGICGSGILDAVAQFYLNGVINRRGRMIGDYPCVRDSNGQREFIMVGEHERDGQPAIVITQHDVREVQLAKAAIHTGIQILLKANNRSEQEIGKVVIAGAFGSYIDVNSAITIGMLPSLPLKHFQQVGNAAGMGARLALLSLKKRDEAQTMASTVRYIELANSPDFMQTFTQACYMGAYREKGAKSS
jgi:uncharacterized 2Fe-2S/4Fe-4S cluster protein (DUF4445 family)